MGWDVSCPQRGSLEKQIQQPTRICLAATVPVPVTLPMTLSIPLSGCWAFGQLMTSMGRRAGRPAGTGCNAM